MMDSGLRLKDWKEAKTQKDFEFLYRKLVDVEVAEIRSGLEQENEKERLLIAQNASREVERIRDVYNSRADAAKTDIRKLKNQVKSLRLQLAKAKKKIAVLTESPKAAEPAGPLTYGEKLNAWIIQNRAG